MGLGQEKRPSKELPSPTAVLTSHVLHGAVKHEIEQGVEPFQDAAGLEGPPRRETERR